jgi:spore coat polysaccharide biosynthesis protein SpsF (cytidylyltransferase family)
MIVFMLRRIARAQELSQFLVATSVEKSDDELAATIVQHGFECFRGDLADVLGRFAAAASHCSADIVVRLTGDCPLMDADLVDLSIRTLISGNYAYVSNVDPPTFPNGLDVEAFTYDALMRADNEAELPTDREHVTPFIRRNKALFPQTNIRSIVDLSPLRWTVDHPDDLEFVRALVNAVSQDDGVQFDRFDFLRALELNSSKLPKNVHARNERYNESGTNFEVSDDRNNS